MYSDGVEATLGRRPTDRKRRPRDAARHRPWAKSTATATRGAARLPEDLPLWKHRADAETCLGSECPRYGDCFVTLGVRRRRIRRRHRQSPSAVRDAAVRKSAYGEVIPSCATLVVDEAHQLEDVATQYFGIAVSNYRIEDLVRDAELNAAGLEGPPRNGWKAGPHECIGQSPRHETVPHVFSGLSMARGKRAWRRRRVHVRGVVEHFEDGSMLAGALEGLEACLIWQRAERPAPLGRGSQRPR